ncbi:MAG: hypothetical protein JKX78_15595 [Alteromonadaceae bacterium]|nr:hypothetical protein [Alteromonadaceae bacterium]
MSNTFLPLMTVWREFVQQGIFLSTLSTNIAKYKHVVRHGYKNTSVKKPAIRWLEIIQKMKLEVSCFFWIIFFGLNTHINFFTEDYRQKFL